MIETVLRSSAGRDDRGFMRGKRVRQALGEARLALDSTVGLTPPTGPSFERLQRWVWGWAKWAAHGQALLRNRRARLLFPYRHLTTLVVLALLGGALLGRGSGLYSTSVAAASHGEGTVPFLVRGQDAQPLSEAFAFAAAPMSVARRHLGGNESPTEGQAGTAHEQSGLARSEVVSYTVQPGDTLETIAERFGIADYTIFWVNGLHAPVKLQPGMVLVIPPLSGVPHTVREGETLASIADRYGVYAGNIVGYPPNGLKYPYGLQAGQEIFVPGGMIEIPRYWAGGDRPSPTIYKMPGGEKLRWPAGGDVSAPFGYSRSYDGFHHGLDIANVWGTPIEAAAAGTVVEAGWGELGWYVTIDHGNGFRTVYGHMAERPWVAKGDTVERGQRIGSMGKTYGRGGYASGVHLHFAVLHHGVYIDPMPLLEKPGG